MKTSRVIEKQIRIQEIQHAAKELFFVTGFKNTTMENIAKKANVSKGTVYFYFKTKEDLYISMMLPVLEELGKQLLEMEKTLIAQKYANCEELVMALLEVYWHVYQFDPDGIRIVESFQQGDHFSEMSEQTHEKVSHRARTNFTIMRRIFTRSITFRLFKKSDVIKLSDATWALFVGIVQLEESKLRSTGKDHIYETLKYSFSLISDAICKA